MTADFLNEMRTVFGKPKALRVESEGVVIIQKGEFSPERRGVSGKFR